MKRSSGVHSLNTFVDFRADFAKPQGRPFELVPGEDLAHFVADALRKRNRAVDAVENGDIEWVVQCRSGEHEFWIRIWPDDFETVDRWEVACPSRLGWFRRLMGTSDHDQHKALLVELNEIIRSAPGARDLRWFDGYDLPELRDRKPFFAGPIRER